MKVIKDIIKRVPSACSAWSVPEKKDGEIHLHPEDDGPIVIVTDKLVEDGLVLREQYKEIPPRVEYSLTELGISLSPVIRELEIWGTENVLTNR